MPLMDSSSVKGAIECLAWNEFVLKLLTDRATEEYTVNSTLEFSTSDAPGSAIQLGLFG